ncbi:MAG: trp operon repressor [Treponema sp.]|jgi:TrpR family trp operon transcriptional repressor|nr:trp operon repressor [Treponema sp.]
MTVEDPRVQEQIKELCQVLAVAKESDLLESFFNCLLTPAEMADIASRWALVKDLREGKPQREIAKNLGVSLCKITRGSRELKKTGSAFLRVLTILDNLDTEGRSNNGASCPLNPDHDN